MNVCDFCECKFKVNKTGSGGSNRRYCYNCLPDGLNRSDRNNARMTLLYKKSMKYKENIGCAHCGYSKFGGALEWHHKNNDKEFNPSSALMRSWNKYLAEIDKCVLLCANCHREVHAGLIENI